ncbi:hypothetical protein C5N99_01010 [Treponema medium]|nr:hypothetical protein C5N99_01010 [Treponema medium]
MQMLGAYKKHPQAYFLYVEDCFLLSDNADAPYICTSPLLKRDGTDTRREHKLTAGVSLIR